MTLLRYEDPEIQEISHLLASRDGVIGLSVGEYHGRYSDPDTLSIALSFRGHSLAANQPFWVDVLFGRDLVGMFDPENYGLESDPEKGMVQVAVARIGDWLDEGGVDPSGEEPHVRLTGDGAWLRELSKRSPDHDSEILRYMATKSLWEYRRTGWRVMFDEVDCLRLGVGTDDFLRVGETYPEYWEKALETAQAPVFITSHQLIRECQRGSFPSFPRAPVYQVQSYLSEDRYAGPRDYFEKARDKLVGTGRDLPQAVKEAAAALESMLLVMTGRDTGRFSQLADSVEASHNLPPAFTVILNKLWGYASDQPGARHAGRSPPTQDETEAVFLFNTGASALLMLRDLDQAQRD